MLKLSSRKLFGIFLTLGISAPFVVLGQVKFNEVMYDPSGADSSREWIEVINNGSSSVDLTGWKFLENATASNHGLTVVGGSASLNAGSFAVIVIDSAKFLTDWPNFTGNILKASFSSLNNTGSTLILKDNAGVVVDQYSYTSDMGGSGDGNSLQLQSGGNWINASPTPGTVNSSIVVKENTATTTQDTHDDQNNTTNTTNTQENTSTSNNSTSAHYSSRGVSTNKNETTIPLNIGRDRMGSVGSPLEFSVDTTINKERNNVFTWNFGDGTTGSGVVVTHTYLYPGDYVVVLNARSIEGSGVDRLNVTVVDPQFKITQANQDLIEIKNNSNSEVSLYGHALVVADKSFIFPQDTIVKGGKKITLSSQTTGLRPQDISQVLLMEIGNTENNKIASKIEEEKAKKIATLTSQLAQLKTQMAIAQENLKPLSILPSASSTTINKSSLSNTQQLASVLVASSTVIDKGISKWFLNLKTFLLRKK